MSWRGVLYLASISVQTKADSNGIVYHVHLVFSQMPHVFPKAPLIDGSDLLK
jgi:hypothetical protein